MGIHSLLQGNLPDPGIEPRSPALQADSLLSEPPGKPQCQKAKPKGLKLSLRLERNPHVITKLLTPGKKKKEKRTPVNIPQAESLQYVNFHDHFRRGFCGLWILEDPGGLSLEGHMLQWREQWTGSHSFLPVAFSTLHSSYVAHPGEDLLYFPRWLDWNGAFQVLAIFYVLIFSADYMVSSFHMLFWYVSHLNEMLKSWNIFLSSRDFHIAF